MRTALTEEFQCALWKMVATAVLAMTSRIRPDPDIALIGSCPVSVVSDAPTPPSLISSTEGDAMSRNRKFHPVPRGGIDPIHSADDALAVLALAAPYGHDTVVIALDDERRGSSVVIVSDTVERDALFDVIDDPGSDRGIEPTRRRHRRRRRPPMVGGERSVPRWRTRADRVVRAGPIRASLPQGVVR
jgi:hypothetical protein